MESSIAVLEEGYLNSLSEILTMHNDLIDYARIQSIGEDFLEFKPCRTDQELPELYYGTPVKMNVYNCRMGFKVLSGIISRSGKSILKISGLEMLVASDRRQFLRIKTNSVGQVYLLNEDMSKSGAAPVRVHIEDISLGGIQFSTPVIYNLQNNILIKLRLFEFSMELRCYIQRIVKGSGTGLSYYYGCQYADLSQEEEEAMHRMLLRLQQNRRARNNR